MTSMDKAGIGIAIGITAFFVGITGLGDSLQGGSPGGMVMAPQVSQPEPVEPEEAMESQKSMEEIMEQQRQGIMEEEKEMEPEEEPVMVTPPMVEDVPVMEDEGPKTVTVIVPLGTSVPGCEETDECWLPPSITINAGDTVSWDNVDTAAHTVTSGSPTEGPDGLFDSSLLMADSTYEHTFDSSGSYDYFCMVHPWMVGDVQVN